MNEHVNSTSATWRADRTCAPATIAGGIVCRRAWPSLLRLQRVIWVFAA